MSSDEIITWSEKGLSQDLRKLSGVQGLMIECIWLSNEDAPTTTSSITRKPSQEMFIQVYLDWAVWVANQ